MKFTARGIQAIKAPPPPTPTKAERDALKARGITPDYGQVEYWDETVRGLILRVSYGGRKTWCVSYRHGRQKRRLTLGPYPALSLADAREMAEDALREVAHGNDPAADKQAERKAETLGELAAEYIEKYAKKNKRSWRTDELAFERDILPRWPHQKAASITRKEVVRLLDDIVERGAPIQANRVLEILRKAYNWAISRDILIYNPCIGIERPVKERASDRVLTDSEIKAVWAALADEKPDIAAAYKLRLLTAQRGQEVETMRIEDIDRENGWWTIPAERSKNGLSHRVPLSPQTKAVLDELLAGDDRSGGWVFFTPLCDGPMTMLWRTAQDISRRAGVSFVPHDLRRSAASKMTGMGIPRLTVSKLLNHAEAGITKVYDRHSYDPEKRQALDAWGARLEEI
ncbi:MAG: tyrosine-type recombinase/integrase, partial [Alphaproteobacteria bacterium]|nr:tyrosine-type recombinase/integrase [Alphaproteobacteria bacterium]